MAVGRGCSFGQQISLLKKYRGRRWLSAYREPVAAAMGGGLLRQPANSPAEGVPLLPPLCLHDYCLQRAGGGCSTPSAGELANLLTEGATPPHLILHFTYYDLCLFTSWQVVFTTHSFIPCLKSWLIGWLINFGQAHSLSCCLHIFQSCVAHKKQSEETAWESGNASHHSQCSLYFFPSLLQVSTMARSIKSQKFPHQRSKQRLNSLCHPTLTPFPSLPL